MAAIVLIMRKREAERETGREREMHVFWMRARMNGFNWKYWVATRMEEESSRVMERITLICCVVNWNFIP